MDLRSSDHDQRIETGPAEQCCLDDLPPPDTRRWVAGKKAQVAAAVQNGILSADEACRRYQLSVEELSAWQRALCQFGVRGLRATRRIARPAETRWFSRHV